MPVDRPGVFSGGITVGRLASAIALLVDLVNRENSPANFGIFQGRFEPFWAGAGSRRGCHSLPFPRGRSHFQMLTTGKKTRHGAIYGDALARVVAVTLYFEGLGVAAFVCVSLYVFGALPGWRPLPLKTTALRLGHRSTSGPL